VGLNLLELNLAFDLKREINSTERHRRLGWEPLVALELALRQGLPHRLLDLALSGHTQLLEKLSDAGIENVLIHHCLHFAADRCQRLWRILRSAGAEAGRHFFRKMKKPPGGAALAERRVMISSAEHG